jgi:hypothetical protein
MVKSIQSCLTTYTLQLTSQTFLLQNIKKFNFRLWIAQLPSVGLRTQAEL